MLANDRDSVKLQFGGLNVVKGDEVNDLGIFPLWSVVLVSGSGMFLSYLLRNKLLSRPK